MYSIMFILDNMDLLENVLEAWYSTEKTGATIFESTGMHRVMHKKFPVRYAQDFPGFCEQDHYTLISIVSDLEAVKACLQATEAVVGDLSKPNTGVFFAWKVDFVKGAEKTTLKEN